MKPREKKIIKTTISLFITATIFTVLLTQIDLSETIQILKGINIYWLALSYAVLLAAMVISAYRWTLLVKNECIITLWRSFRLTMVGSCFNVFTPSKMGDLSKAYFMRKNGNMNLSKGSAAVILEKALDFLALCAITVLGILILGDFSHTLLTIFFIASAAIAAGLVILLTDITNHRYIKSVGVKKIRIIQDMKGYFDRTRKTYEFPKILTVSLIIWITHLINMYLTFLALNMTPSILLVFGLVPAAILIGQLPITIAGMGTRDSALIYLFMPFFPTAAMLGYGILATLRYVFLAIIGIPFLITAIRKE
ncbi:flippase-like domain-containing protein [Candidatus Woesearchaeota archaeon]|nr:flippase-like domain-containing protein [Candidatus Woesearchaeota archaeon]